MSVDLQLRGWQAKFRQALLRHDRDDFLLVACPAAGKTIAAAVGAAEVMRERECDQLIVVCPTVVVRDQWAATLGELGFKMLTSIEFDGWPEWVHGACVTYAQIARRPELFEQACEQRPTMAVCDEIHHAGECRSWGEALERALEGARMRLLLSGTPFRSDEGRIRFLRYTANGKCRPDFAYDYQQAVRDGVCRPIEFRSHDGEITWQEAEPVTARFSDKIPISQRTRRLRASLDPAQPYIAALLADAHEDLMELRERVPDAAGLVVCENQQHALAVDRLLSEITGHLPVLAMSDIPRAHQAIAAFAHDDEPWLVSVRMVSEGVDIPRLGVIAWATASCTELMVRQVAGRALRGRGDHANLPAIVHIPADPQLVTYASRLDVLGGVAPQRDRWRSGERQSRPSPPASRRGVQGPPKRIDPAPFIKWFDSLAQHVGQASVLRRCGMDPESGARRINEWRRTKAGVLKLYDACHMAGIDFDTLFDGDEYEAARQYMNSDEKPLDLGALEAQPIGDAPRTISPPVELAPARRVTQEPVAIVTPDLPPSPAAVREAEQAHERSRGDVAKLLGIYAQLQQSINPAYQLAAAHIELAREVGPIRADSPDEQIAEAVAWVNRRTVDLARAHPEHFKQLARTRRRLQAA